MTMPEAISAAGESGIRHESWHPSTALRWTAAGWYWRNKLHRDWRPASDHPTIFGPGGLLAAPVIAAGGWSVVRGEP